MALFLVLFLWQFPHFMAIAWLYRRDYAQAGYQMLTVVDATGDRAGRQSVIAALALIPVSILPVLAAPGMGSLLYVAGGVARLWAAGHRRVVLAAAKRLAGDDCSCGLRSCICRRCWSMLMLVPLEI